MSIGERVTFVTPSMGTKWVAYSQALLRLFFPQCRRIVVDGTRNWDPLYFASIADQVVTDYQVLVDEDCFILDPSQLSRMIMHMDANPGLAVMATPDGGTFHRDYNPFACNCFFVVIRTEHGRSATRGYNWRCLDYDNVNHITTDDHIENLDESRIDYGKKEPYYPFFWAVIASGYKIEYLVPDVDRRLLASTIHLEGYSNPFLIHMWWVRQWFSENVDPYLKVSNGERYHRLEKEVLAPLFRSRKAKFVLNVEELRRLGKRIWLRARSTG